MRQDVKERLIFLKTQTLSSPHFHMKVLLLQYLPRAVPTGTTGRALPIRLVLPYLSGKRTTYVLNSPVRIQDLKPRNRLILRENLLNILTIQQVPEHASSTHAVSTTEAHNPIQPRSSLEQDISIIHTQDYQPLPTSRVKLASSPTPGPEEANKAEPSASNFAARTTADSFFEAVSDPELALPSSERIETLPHETSPPKFNVQTLKTRFTAQELEKQFSRELSRLDRNHGPDLKISMLSALFITLPVLVLYYIRSLPFRLMAVILFTLVFAVGLSLTYRPKRGEVFATTAA